MNDVRPGKTPELTESAGRRKTDPELRVAGQGNAREADLTAGQALGNAKTWRFVPLAWADDGHAVPPLRQTVHYAAQRHGNAVYFRSVSFSNESKMQSRVAKRWSE
jgi:hypothetical protein